MQNQGNAALLCSMYEDHQRENKSLRVKKQILKTETRALQKIINSVMGQDTSSETTDDSDEVDSQVQATTPGDSEAFRQASIALILVNKALGVEIDNLSGDMKALVKRFKHLTRQKLELMRLEEDVIRCRRLCDAMGIAYNENETKEKLRLPKLESGETQTLSAWQDLENANKLLLLEKEACEAEKTSLQREIAALTEEMCEAEGRERRALRDNEALQKEVQELRTLLQRESEERAGNTGEATEDALGAELEEEEAVLGVHGPLVGEEEVDFLRERVGLQSEEGPSCPGEDLGNEPRLSLWQRLVRPFVRRGRGRHSGGEPGEQAREEAKRRPTLRERFAGVFNRRSRRAST